MALTVTLSQLDIYTFDKENPKQIQLASDKALKIESIGIAGANGTVFLQDDSEPPINLAILFTTIDENDFSAQLPFWLPPGFNGWLYNDSGYQCAVSVGVHDYTVS